MLNASLPRTSSRLERMDPSREVDTTTSSPLLRAVTARMISTTFPNVAFTRPPISSPVLSAMSSVTSPSSSASGTIARRFCSVPGVVGVQQGASSILSGSRGNQVACGMYTIHMEALFIILAEFMEM